jgi:hypothetical protein
VKAHLLNSVGDVRTREGEVLESPGKTPVLNRVGHGRVAEAESLGDVSTGVVADFQTVMPALSRISIAYLACERCMPEELRVTAMPMK